VVAMTRLALVFFCLWDRRDGCFSTPRAEYTTFWKFFVKNFLTLAFKKTRGVLQIGNKYLLLAKGECPLCRMDSDVELRRGAGTS